MNNKLIGGIAVWLLGIAASFAILYLGMNLTIGWSLLDGFVSVTVYTAFTLSFKFQAQFVEFQRQKLPRFLLTHLLAALLVSALWVSIIKIFLFWMIDQTSYQRFFNESIAVRIIIGMTVYFLITAFNYLFLYYDNYKEKVESEVSLKNLLTETELKNLKFQINPHFIFNALNSIASLTHISSEKAASMTIKLADFMRSTLTNTKPFSILEDELKNCRMYVDIEKIRFGDKFTFEEKIDESLLKEEIPSMILQPLFENAIKYGVYEAMEKVQIQFIAERIPGYIKIAVENNFDSGGEKHKGEGIGLTNINKRMQMLYNQNDLIKIEKEENIFRVMLFFPLKEFVVNET
ncbi:MAG: histidine kinase [Ignavibacteria bacterium]|nr:histidine kinase [Ignavibacteria bacterium]